MNRRQFLRGASLAAASGLTAKAEMLDWLARQPVSISRPTLLVDRFAGMQLFPLLRIGDSWEYELQWRTDTMPSLIEGQADRIMSKTFRISSSLSSGSSWPSAEIAYHTQRKQQEIIRDCAYEEGWLDKYRKIPPIQPPLGAAV